MNDLGGVAALFVPGNRPDRFAKAGAAGDVVVLDLEDAVPDDEKDAALLHVLDALGTGGMRAVVRMVAPTDSCAEHQLRELAARAGPNLQGVMIPKADDASAVSAISAQLAAVGVPVVPLIETAAGVMAAREVAAVPGVRRIALGLLDLAAELGVESDSPALDHARAAVVFASAAAGLTPPWDSPSPDINDLDAVRRAACRGRAWGFGGALCIHPAQVGVVRESYEPSAEETRWAMSVVSAGDAAVQVDGRMVDRPVVERARRILDRSRRELR
ncbi:HpcH/HpaI aldolase/citrate lyase family protein [Nakamurella alba]|uniref:HpcH/HpaI aldolase/citrate lyase family protein n=1 Tax=Nakamurella alba TaxID=2665158 RepID=UPI002AC33F4C|nr:aldolase/citrate lyase family protein [Nakamurella alba]